MMLAKQAAGAAEGSVMKIGKWMAWLLTVAVLAWGAGSALAQSEPTIDQIYQAASGGRVSEARSMIDQVVKNHPKSAKAHYVKAEVAARQHEAAVAKEELATAESIAPGLPFARPESVQALRTQIADLSSARAPARTPALGAAAAPAPAPSAPGLPWGKIVIGLAIALGIMALLRRRMPAPTTYGSAPAATNAGVPGANPGGYGPGTYGPGTYGPGMQPPPGTGPYPYGPPAAPPSMGSTLGRGLAAGLAVGAGAVAAQEIGRRMFDHHGNPVAPDANAANPGNFGLSDPSAMDNVDLGGNDFGINDAGSWDDGGSADAGGGGDWDT
jgi:uncharacterized protein